MAKKKSRKKPAIELTDEEALKRLFPKAVRTTIKKKVEDGDQKAAKGKR